MTKKDFQTFARMIRTQRQRIIHTNNTVENSAVIADKELHAQLDSITESLADIFFADNDKFDVEKFIKACTVDTES